MTKGYRDFESKAAYEAYYSDERNYAWEIPAMKAYAEETDGMRTVAPGVDQPIRDEHPAAHIKPKEGEPRCACGTHPEWACKDWPICVRI